MTIEEKNCQLNKIVQQRIESIKFYNKLCNNNLKTQDELKAIVEYEKLYSSYLNSNFPLKDTYFLSMQEKIMCAANWYKDIPCEMPPINVDRGLVLCGFRHGFIINEMHELTKLRTCTFGEDACGNHVQGFLTNHNRFVDRNEAALVAYISDQVGRRLIYLISENLW